MLALSHRLSYEQQGAQDAASKLKLRRHSLAPQPMSALDKSERLPGAFDKAPRRHSLAPQHQSVLDQTATGILHKLEKQRRESLAPQPLSGLDKLRQLSAKRTRPSGDQGEVLPARSGSEIGGLAVDTGPDSPRRPQVGDSLGRTCSSIAFGGMAQHAPHTWAV